MLPLRLHSILLLVLAGFLCLPRSVCAQLSPSLFSYPNNHLPWYSIESDHFQVHFQEGNNRSAQLTARIAEEIYPSVTRLYQHEPDTKIDIVLNDRQDYSNGAAYFFDNQIDIWVSALKTPLRGEHNWLWDVITHEFTHIVQLQVAMKKSRRLPAIYFQWLSYSDVRRPDVLYGYPKGLITYPFASVNVPAWLAEGVAQYQLSHLYYDYWDSHRDMLLRTAMLLGEPLGFEEMGIFNSKNALERERIYNQGFAFTSYLVNRFGEKVLLKISEALGQPGVYSIDRALEEATGTPGRELFEDFVSSSKNAYQQATASIKPTKTKPVEDKGFFNFYPKVSPSGNRLAYLSNKKSRNQTAQLFIRHRDSLAQVQAINIGQWPTFDRQFTHREQDPIVEQLQPSYSFSPDGGTTAFSRQKLNSYGEQYNDLFLYDSESDSETRLTYSQRLSSPAWHPTEGKLAAIRQSRGSTNLVAVDLQTSGISTLTEFHHGEQVYTPAWHPNGQVLYFSFSDDATRNIYRLDYPSGNPKPVLQDSLIDYRDPYVDRQGKYLYYAADLDGIFNIYRIPLEQGYSEPQKLTSCLGGAFMPHVQGNTLYFAEFKADGYKISSVTISDTLSSALGGSYQKNYLSSLKLPGKQALSGRPNLDEFEVLPPARMQKLGQTDSLNLSYTNPESNSQFTLRPHENTYTSFSFYPVIRFDNYSRLNGSNGRLLTAGQLGQLSENLLRDLKLGTYFSSREVTGRLNIFGGAMVGLTSEPANGIGDFFSPARLTDLDRDLFLNVEYRGLPFIKQRWSPTVSLELYNLRRNVADGLTIEEFPCTSCLPDTTSADIAYSIWEADIFLRSKINEHNLVEIGGGYSPYRVQTDGFLSQELEQYIPSSSSEYFRGTTLTAAYVYENFANYPNSDVAPIGLRTSLRYTYEPNKLLEEYEIEDGVLSPIYQSVKNHSLESSLRFGYPMGQSSALNFYGRGFSYLNHPDDFFYLDYIGGFTGMRSYPYFAIGGNSTAMAQLSYTFPVVQNLNQQVGRHTLDKLFLRLFAETGNGWNGPLNIGNNLKTGAGCELRFAFNSYYLFPLKLFVSGAYGFNKFDINLPDEFITESSGRNVQYGNELIFHLGLTFDFDLLNHD